MAEKFKMPPGMGRLGKRVNIGRIMKKVTKSASTTMPVEYESLKANNTEELTKIEELEKDAFTVPTQVRNGFYAGLGSLAAGAVAGGLAYAWDKHKESQNNQKYLQTLQMAIQLSPNLRSYDIRLLQSYLNMIAKASPTVASDPRLLANYLESMLDAEGHLNLSTFGEIANLENTVLDNAKMRNAAREAILSGVGKGLGEGFAGGVKNLGKAFGRDPNTTTTDRNGAK